MKIGVWTRTLVVAGLAFASLGAAVPNEELDREAYRVAHDLMSPFCPGRTLADCPSPYAREVRREIRESLAAGMPASEVKERLTETLGDEIRGRPQRAWGWAMPALVTFGGLLAAVVVIRRLGKPSRVGVAARAADERSVRSSDDLLAARLDEELRELS